MSLPVFAPDQLLWAGRWSADIPSWIEICDWIWNNRTEIARHTGMSKFDRSPAGRTDHPLMNVGIVRHGIAAALWTRHQQTPEYSTSTTNDSASGRYMLLQAHVLAAYFECRYRTSDLDFFESYDGEVEAPVAPVRTAGVSPAIREFSRDAFAPLIGRLNVAQATTDFAANFSNSNYSLDDIDVESRARARQYLRSTQRFFARFQRMLTGWKPQQSIRRGWGGGGRQRRPGYVHLDSSPGILFAEPEIQSDESEAGPVFGQRVVIDLALEPQRSARDDEASGLSPDETTEYTFHLYDPKELRGRLMLIRQQQMAIEMRAQAIPFDYANLTPPEIFDFWKLADQRISEYLQDATPDQDSRHRAVAGLVLKLALCWGQRIERLRTLSIQWISPVENSLPTLPGDEVALLFRAEEPNNWSGTRFLGLHLPGIMPSYRTHLPDELEDVDRDNAPSFLLPDYLGIGLQLIEVLRIRNSPDGSAFGIRQDSLKAAVRGLLAAARNERLTHEKISRVLQEMVRSLTGDQSLAWILVADTQREDEPRMHYTRQSIPRIEKTYQEVMAQITKYVGAPRLEPSVIETGLNDSEASVGARFVISSSSLRGMIEELGESLRDRHLNREDPIVVAKYHNRYMLYCLLYQGLDTGIRINTKPQQIFASWDKRGGEAGCRDFGVADKGGLEEDRARPIRISRNLARQFSSLKLHDQEVRQRPGMWIQSQVLGESIWPYFVTTEDQTLLPLSPGVLTDLIQSVFGYPIPANFHRAFLRTELIHRGCHPQFVDCFMGHANIGELSFSSFSTFDFERYFTEIDRFRTEIHTEIGLVPIESRLVPFVKRRP